MKPGARFPCRLLVDLPNWVGDVIMALPALRLLVDANRDGETVLHSRPRVKRLLELLFPPARVLVSERHDNPIRTAHDLCRNGGRYHVGLTLRHASRAKFILRFAARHTLGSEGSGAALLLSRSFPVDRTRHQVYDTDPIVEALGLGCVDPAWKPPLPAALAEQGRQVLVSAGIWGKPLVGLAPAAAWGISKKWPGDRFGRLALSLADQGLQPVILIGPDEEPVAAEVNATAGDSIPVVGPEVDVAGLAGIMSHLAVLACNDSGPMHLAAMVGTPVVAVFGPTDPNRTRPLCNNHVVLSRDLDCSPCLEPVCPLGHQNCLKEIETTSVVDAVLQLSR